MGHPGLKNKVVIVAGGTGGIGRAISRLLLQENATVVAVSRNAGSSPLAAANAYFPTLYSTKADLCKPDVWNGLVEMVERQHGPVEVLINCVGILAPGGILRLSDAEIRQMVETNLLNMVFGVKAVLPGMKRRRHGLVINIGSLGGIMPMPHEELYSMTKAAVRAMSLSLDQELRASGVRFSTVSPGPVRTTMLDQEAGTSKSALAFVQNPLSPESVARVIVKLIQHPRAETVIPNFTGRLALFVGRFSRIFTLCYPLLETVGRWKRDIYRQRYGTYSRESFMES